MIDPSEVQEAMRRPGRFRYSCPFCGCRTTNVKQQQHRGQRFWVECCGCGARGPISYDGKTQATNLWNRYVSVKMPKKRRKKGQKRAKKATEIAFLRRKIRVKRPVLGSKNAEKTPI